MGTKIIKTPEIIKVCPNREHHIKDLVRRMQANPGANMVPAAFCVRHKKSVFCEQCGARLINETIEHETSVCERCGENVSSDDSYCPHCGDTLR